MPDRFLLCIEQGERFANLVIKTAISTILQQSKMELLDSLPEPDYRKQSGTPGPGKYSLFGPHTRFTAPSDDLIVMRVYCRQRGQFMFVSRQRRTPVLALSQGLTWFLLEASKTQLRFLHVVQATLARAFETRSHVWEKTFSSGACVIV